MITDDQELKATQERIVRFQRWLVQMRQTARPDEFEAAAGGYRLEVERTQAEVLDYIMRPTVVHPEPQAV
jgi:hypothetical protein